MRPLRTLLVDNYDSFTYNLYHLITSVNGVAPVVIHNDEKGWRNDYLRYFDNVVISPGPGRPERTADFGLCHGIIKTATVPVLGICLGHQGICAIHGARIGLAPEPRHGRVSSISHLQKDLFRNIPSPFSAVRYHSLAVYDLPESLTPMAWSKDGIVMAVTHRSKPLFGVQFHPESICTDHGETLFTNFAEITRTRQREKKGPLSPDMPGILFAPPYSDIRPLEQKKPKTRYTILHEQLPALIEPEALFDVLFRKSAFAAWLDSSRMGYGSGRFSILCDASGPLGRIASADVNKQCIELISLGKQDLIKADFFSWLEEDLEAHAIDSPDTPFEFSLGWVGYIGYEMKSLTEQVAGPASLFPDACLLFCDRAAVIDHQENRIWLLVLADDASREKAQAWLGKARQELMTPDYPGPLPASLPDKLALNSPLRLRHDKAHYLDLITQCQEAIRQGESYEICLTNMAEASTSADPWTAWRMLRQSSPAPYGAYLQLGELAVLSCSPERFLSISRDRTIESKPIKGTRPRSKDPARDRQLMKELATSEKEKAENLMIVDLVRNDLGRIAQAGSVTVSRLFDIESYQAVHQMVSTVSARVEEGISATRCVRAAFPGGSMTGAPKKRALEIIDRLEAGPRGVYSGILGYFSLCGSVDLSIIIRTLVMSGGKLSFGVGGAITALSDPEEEFEETRVKAGAFLKLFDTDF